MIECVLITLALILGGSVSYDPDSCYKDHSFCVKSLVDRLPWIIKSSSSCSGVKMVSIFCTLF